MLEWDMEQRRIKYDLEIVKEIEEMVKKMKENIEQRELKFDHFLSDAKMKVDESVKIFGKVQENLRKLKMVSETEPENWSYGIGQIDEEDIGIMNQIKRKRQEKKRLNEKDIKR